MVVKSRKLCLILLLNFLNLLAQSNLFLNLFLYVVLEMHFRAENTFQYA